LTKATEAALSVGGKLAIPDFGPDREPGMTDFNDMAVKFWLEAVARTIAGAIDPAKGAPQPSEEYAPASDSAVTAKLDDHEAILRLARLAPLDYDRIRKTEAEALGIRPATLDKQVANARKAEGDNGMDFPDVDPWPHPIVPQQLLSEIATTIRRFIVCDRETADAAALWIALTWFIDNVQVAPLAVITAPEKRCGKSQLLFVLGRMVRRPLAASNVSAAALFRAVDAWKPTLLVDEADSFLRENEELRGILNAGHTRESAYVVRVVGEDLMPQRFNVWGCKALAGIGHLPDTVMDRAIVLELRRKLPHENVERLRHAEPGLFDEIAEKLARFAEDQKNAVRQARPVLPPELHDRAQDNWEPLLAIADVSGGDWPELARRAALKLSGSDNPTMTTGTELLADVKAVFEMKCVDRISTHDLIEALCADMEAPWVTYNRGKSISPRQVAKKLADYNIASQTIRIGTSTAKGYFRGWFDEAFSRYLPSPILSSVTPSQTRQGAGLHVTDSESRYDNKTQSVTSRPAPDGCCDVVTDKRVDTGSVEIVEETF
jgi:putative DNA primase/helicase